MEPLFDVCYAGELQEGQDLQSVRLKLQKLFNANPETLDRLFSGKPQVLKRGCDRATAQKYQQAMSKAGAKPVIRPSSKPEVHPSAKATTASQSAASGLALAPPGTDVLRPDERAQAIVAEIDTSSLNIAEAGADLTQPRAPSVEAPDTSHLAVAEPGEGLSIESVPRTVNQPDTGGISLSPEGTDFSDCAPPTATAPPANLSGIELAPVGADVLEQQYRKKDLAKAPDTSHISIE